MKRVDKSKIGLIIGDDIKKLIKEIRSLKNDYSLITEYAESRKGFAKSILALTPPMFIHWCLVKFTSLAKDKLEYRDHWKSELYNFINQLNDAEIKPNNNRKIVEKLLASKWFEVEDYDKELDKLINIVSFKFAQEKIDDPTPYAMELQRELPYLVQLIAYGTNKEVKEYVINL